MKRVAQFVLEIFSQVFNDHCNGLLEILFLCVRCIQQELQFNQSDAQSSNPVCDTRPSPPRKAASKQREINNARTCSLLSNRIQFQNTFTHLLSPLSLTTSFSVMLPCKDTVSTILWMRKQSHMTARDFPKIKKLRQI